MSDPRGYYSRLYLPHYDGGPIATICHLLPVGCRPAVLLRGWEEELRLLTKTEQEIEPKKAYRGIS